MQKNKNKNIYDILAQKMMGDDANDVASLAKLLMDRQKIEAVTEALSVFTFPDVEDDLPGPQQSVDDAVGAFSRPMQCVWIVSRRL